MTFPEYLSQLAKKYGISEQEAESLVIKVLQ